MALVLATTILVQRSLIKLVPAVLHIGVAVIRLITEPVVVFPAAVLIPIPQLLTAMVLVKFVPAELVSRQVVQQALRLAVTL